MIKVIVFSKDRPMQLHAYLESLEFCIGSRYHIIVIIPQMDQEYSLVADRFKHVTFVEEVGGHDATVRSIVNQLDDTDYVLFGCDDVIYIGQCNIDFVPMFLDANPKIIGFSLRLGTNINMLPQPNLSNDKRFYIWNWLGQPWHWGYPFELMGSIYSAKLIKYLVNNDPDELKCPNFLEGHGVTKCVNERFDQPFLAMFNTTNYCVAQDVNRVQDHYPNRTNGGATPTAEELKQLYLDGTRLNWPNLFGISPSDVFVGAKYWALSK